jgi:hypothetical protein
LARKPKQDQPAAQPNGKTAPTQRDAMPQETATAYFRRVFKEDPRLLKGRSNEEVLKRWLEDHPGESEVPQSAKNVMSNVKSQLRKKRRQKKGETPAGPSKVTQPAPSLPRVRDLEALEARIDDCLTFARQIDSGSLEEVVRFLRRARNEVVWQSGESVR